MGSGAGTRSAMTAGVRKMPPPMVEPTSTATALQNPSRRGSRSPQRSARGAAEEGDMRGRIYSAAAPCSHALHESNVRRRPTSHSEPRQRTSARLVVDELRRPRDSTPARLGVEAGSPAGNVERLALPGAGEMLLDCPITVRSVDRIMLALVPIELEETMTPIPDVLEPGYFRASALPAVHDAPAKIADVQVRRRLDQRQHFGSLRGPQDCLLHPLPLSLCSLICVRHGAARCQVTRDTTRPATHRRRSLPRPTFPHP